MILVLVVAVLAVAVAVAAGGDRLVGLGRAVVHGVLVLLAFWCTWLTWAAATHLRQRRSV